MQPFAAGGLPGGSGTDSASMAAPPSIQELLGRSAGDLGISPQLAAWWSGDHDAAAPHWFAQEADLRAAYTKCATLPHPSLPITAHFAVPQARVLLCLQLKMCSVGFSDTPYPFVVSEGYGAFTIRFGSNKLHTFRVTTKEAHVRIIIRTSY